MLSFVASLPESQNLNQRLWGNEERIDTRLDKEIWDWIDWALGWRNADIVYYIQIKKEISLVDFGWSYLYRRDHYSRWRSYGGHCPHTINIHSWIRGRLCHSSKPHSAKALLPNGTETLGFFVWFCPCQKHTSLRTSFIFYSCFCCRDRLNMMIRNCDDQEARLVSASLAMLVESARW